METINQILINIISGLMTNLPWFLLAIWSVKTITRQVPHWIENWDKMKMKHYRINLAMNKKI